MNNQDSLDRSLRYYLMHFRVLKTVVAGFLSLLIAHELGIDYPLFTALACAFCIRQTFYGSLRRFLSEIRITVFATGISLLGGAFVEVTFDRWGEIVVLEFAIAAIAMGLVVVVIQYFQWYDTLSIGLLTVLYILLVPAADMYGNQFLARGVARLGSILVGAIVALVIDFLFSGFEYSNLFYRRTRQALQSIEQMLETFVEAILLRNGERTRRVMDQAIDSLNILGYVSEKLDDLEKEMDFRGERIHDFSREQVQVLHELIRDLRLICFQMESASINYLRVLESMEGETDPLPDTDEDELSTRGRKLSKILQCLHQAVWQEDPEQLEAIPRRDHEKGFHEYFEDAEETSEAQLLAIDTMSSIDRIEFYLERVADTLERYYQLRNNE